MPPFGRRSHLSQRGPRPQRSSTTAIVGTTVVAVLAVVVVVLAFRVADKSGDDTSGADRAQLETRIAEVDGRVADLHKTVRDLARQALANLDRATKSGAAQNKSQAAVARCLTQLQNEVDDLQAYLAYGTPPRRDRVSGGCVALLQPQIKG